MNYRWAVNLTWRVRTSITRPVQYYDLFLVVFSMKIYDGTFQLRVFLFVRYASFHSPSSCNGNIMLFLYIETDARLTALRNEPNKKGFQTSFMFKVTFANNIITRHINYNVENLFFTAKTVALGILKLKYLLCVETATIQLNHFIILFVFHNELWCFKISNNSKNFQNLQIVIILFLSSKKCGETWAQPGGDI